MAPIPGNVLSFICSMVAVFTITPLDGCPIPPAPKNTYSGLDVFDLLPITNPAKSVPAGTPVQFNGYYGGQKDVTEQLGWWPKPASDRPANATVDLVSFIQSNKKEGIAFWSKRTLFQIFLRPVADHAGTYSVMLGSTGVEPNPDQILSDNFTVSEITKLPHETSQRYAFGWRNDVDHWFACGGTVAVGEFYGLYYGKMLERSDCSDYFELQARYYV